MGQENLDRAIRPMGGVLYSRIDIKSARARYVFLDKFDAWCVHCEQTKQVTGDSWRGKLSRTSKTYIWRQYTSRGFSRRSFRFPNPSGPLCQRLAHRWQNLTRRQRNRLPGLRHQTRDDKTARQMQSWSCTKRMRPAVCKPRRLAEIRWRGLRNHADE